MIEWYREGAREDRDPQRFDATAGSLFLRVIERDDGERPIYYSWGVATVEHPTFEDELAETCIARGVRRSPSSAKDACREAAKRHSPGATP